MPSGPLQGLRVLDLSRVLAGPFCTMLLGDLGAEVVKVENPHEGDLTREWGPPFKEGESAYFLSVNRNKRSIAVDLKAPEGRDMIRALAARSDVVIENFRPGVAARLGLGYEDLRILKPDLIYCSISGYGQDGPYRDRPALDLVLQALGGLMSITGEPGRPPVRVGVALVDLGAGLFAATAVLAALHRRHETEKGEYIDLSILDGMVSLLTYMAQYFFLTGNAPPALGSGHPNLFPYQAFPTEDGWIVVAAPTDEFWRSTCRVLGLKDLVANPRYTKNSDRVDHRGELEEVLSKAFRRRRTSRWLELLVKAGVPCAPVNDVSQVFADPQVRARGMEVEVLHPKLGPTKLVGLPAKFRSAPGDVRRPPPLLGEHTREILTELGYTPQQLKALSDKGVIKAAEGLDRKPPSPPTSL